jgi:hypothetical protein
MAKNGSASNGKATMEGSAKAPPPERILHKVVLTKKDGLTIEFTQGPQNHMVQSQEPPKESLVQTLQLLGQYVCGMLEWPKEYVDNNFRVRGVTIKHNGKAGQDKAQIHCTKILQGAPPFNFVTPLKLINTPKDALSDGPQKDGKTGKVLNVHPQEVQRIVNKVMELADGFLNGERGQVPVAPLFAQTGPDTREVEEEEPEEVEQD